MHEIKLDFLCDRGCAQRRDTTGAAMPREYLF